MADKPKKVGEWEKHTKGIGFKLLSKFGYSGEGGLGAKGHGISQAVEVVVRPTNLGLGFGDQKEASTLKVNKKIEAEWRGVEYKDEDGYVPEVEKLASEKNWKKGTKKRAGSAPGKASGAELIAQYMSSIAKEINENGDASVTIIDMRHAEARSKIEEYLDEQKKRPPKLGQELLYNINLIAEQHNNELAKVSRQLNSEQKKKASLLEDKIQYKKQTSEQEIRLQKLQKLAAVLERVNLTISEQNTDEEEEEEAAKKDEITVDSVISLIETLFDNFPEEFTIFGLMNLIPELLSRTADLTPVTCGQWRPLDNPRLLIHICESWEPLVKFFERRGERALASHTASSFQTTIEKVCLPVIRRSFSNDWKVLDPAQAEAAVSLLEALKVVFPSGQGPLWEQTVDMLIMPRLVSAVADWQPLRDRPAHLWLLPWLPVLTSKLSAVYPELRRKMGVALTHWQPASLALEGFESLILRHVVPKLVTTLRDGLQISPSGQDITPFQCVMLWQHSLPPLHLSCLFAGEFFPKWIQTLSAWLHSPAADFSEIGEWYSGWKSMFAGTPLEEDETIL
eukprot:gene19447-19868_t